MIIVGFLGFAVAFGVVVWASIRLKTDGSGFYSC
jgi:hypothetical protein